MEAPSVYVTKITVPWILVKLFHTLACPSTVLLLYICSLYSARNHFELISNIITKFYKLFTCKTLKAAKRLVFFKQTLQWAANSIEFVVTVIALLQYVHLTLSDVFVFICSQVGQSWLQAIQLHSNQYLLQKNDQFILILYN